VDEREKHAPDDEVGGTFGMWINKRTVEVLEIPFRHRLVAQPGGWRLEALEAGKLVARFGNRPERMDLDQGDYVLSSGDDFYVSLQRRKDGRPEGPQRDRAGDRPGEPGVERPLRDGAAAGSEPEVG